MCFILCENVLPACVYVDQVHIWYLQRSEDDIKYPKLKLWMVVNHHVGCCEFNPGPLLQPQILPFLISLYIKCSVQNTRPVMTFSKMCCPWLVI